MRHPFEDSFNMNILNWKVSQKNISIRMWSWRKAGFLSEITLLFYLKIRQSKSCNIFLKTERFRKSKFTLSKVKSELPLIM